VDGSPPNNLGNRFRYSFRTMSSKASNPGNLINDSVTSCWL
jgi:hypothetical protein